MDVAERFWGKVDRMGSVPEHHQRLGRCWVWTACCFSTGYGAFAHEGKTKHAHRVSWFLTTGSWPEKQVNHLCRNRACVRPSHLEDVSCRENLLDSPATGASRNAAKTHCPQGHPYDADNTWLDVKRNIRHCRECMRFHRRESWRRKHPDAPRRKL